MVVKIGYRKGGVKTQGKRACSSLPQEARKRLARMESQAFGCGSSF
jgi:hypothetical protein